MHIKVKDKNIYFEKIDIKNELLFIDRLIKIYIAINMDKELPQAERAIVCYYVKYGISEETFQKIREDLPKYYKNQYIYQVNKKLRDKGYLLKHKTNLKKFHLNEDLQHLRQKFFIDNCKTYMIGFR